MTITVPDISTDLSLIEELDFDPEFDCEHQNHGKRAWHDGPAHYIVSRGSGCPGCGEGNGHSFMLCAPAWAYAGVNGLHCTQCLWSGERSDWWTLIGTVK